MMTDKPIFKNNYNQETGFSTGKNINSVPTSFETAAITN
jgi:hypothetical protein